MADCVLYNGDCLQVMDKLYSEGVKVDAAICDLPYFKVSGASFDNEWHTLKEYLTWVWDCIKSVKRLLKQDATVMFFTSRQYNRHICYLMDRYFKERRIIIWARKRGFNTTRGKALASGYEPISYYVVGNPVFNNLKIKVDTNRPEYNTGTLKDGITLSDVWTDIKALPHNSKEKVNHPTQKPIKLMERCISICTNEDDTVLDFCMGSGTTGVACQNLNRNFIGIEVDEEYFKIAEDRINKG